MWLVTRIHFSVNEFDWKSFEVVRLFVRFGVWRALVCCEVRDAELEVAETPRRVRSGLWKEEDMVGPERSHRDLFGELTYGVRRRYAILSSPIPLPFLPDCLRYRNSV